MTTIAETCLYVGRFQPPHNGHAAVLRELAENFERLIVGISNAHISHTPQDPLTGGERYELLALLSKAANLENVDLIPIPVDPFPTIWVPTIATIAPRFTCVYGRNPMHATIFEHWGYKLVNLDGHIRTTSGTEVRRLMASGSEEWRALVPESTHALLEDVGIVGRVRQLAIDKNI